MTSVHTRKILIPRSALTLAAVLFNASAAFAAESAESGQPQAQALLSASPQARTDRASVELPTFGAAALANDAQDQARSLLAATVSRTERRADAADRGVKRAASAGNQATAYAGAQESARKMILGRDA